MHLLNLIRWKNLVIIILAQVLIKYALFEQFEVFTTLSTIGFSLLVFTTLCIAAAGNIINDIYDVEADAINKPNHVIVGKHISEKTAYNLFFALNIIGIILGFYISHSVGRSSFFAIFVLISLSLYVYASYLKGIAIVGNILVSVLVAMSILIVAIFDLLPSMIEQNRDTQLTFFQIARDYAVFAFLVNLVREMVKDIQDVDGDHKAGYKTLPILLGRERGNKIAFIVSMLPTAAVIYFIVTYLYTQQIAIAYFLICVVAPLIYATIRLFSAEHKSQYNFISNIYKIVMVLGLLSLLLYPVILK